MTCPRCCPRQAGQVGLAPLWPTLNFKQRWLEEKADVMEYVLTYVVTSSNVWGGRWIRPVPCWLEPRLQLYLFEVAAELETSEESV